MKEGRGINTNDHLEYFLIDEAWEAIKKTLNRPIIASAKYSIGDRLLFFKERFIPIGTLLEFIEKETIKNVTCEGTVDYIMASHEGSGEVLYGIKNIIPECLEDNPYALESNVISLIS